MNYPRGFGGSPAADASAAFFQHFHWWLASAPLPWQTRPHLRQV